MHSNMVVLVFLLALSPFLSQADAGILDDPATILGNFKDKYNNSQSDLIYLLDVSGSVSDYGFQSEKVFVESMLNEFSLAPYSTRSAVITFGKVVKTDLNYIDINAVDKLKQKCEFMPWFQHNVVHRYGWATHMKDAFQEASNLINTATSHQTKRNVHTVVVLITDGYWNGGDPRSAANQLKSSGVEVFAVGVDGYSQWQIRALASSNEHALEFSSFTKFRELAMYIRGDAHDKIFMEVPNKCTTSSGCDRDAFCACGTVSGQYQCVCKQGYYGAGIPGQCFPCPQGSYKRYPNPDDCTGCPPHSTTHSTGNTDISQCVCWTGYQGNPKLGVECIPVTCSPAQQAPSNGFLKASCNNIYQSVCAFGCNEGYTLSGSQSRTCQADKNWSGSPPQCDIVECPPLPNINHGTKSCSGLGKQYGDRCTFSCENGYDLNGSSERVCQKDGQWTGTSSHCEPKKCPILRQLAFGSVEPVDCVTTPQPYQRGCVMRCVTGYEMDGDANLQCGADGQWIGTFPTCKDTRPPTITCPPDVSEGTDPESPTRQVTWSDPQVSDNAELHDASAKPTVVKSPANLVSPHNFAPGVTRITYTATDKSGNSASCVFTIIIVDNEPPALYCPANIEVEKETTTPTKKVYWPMPTYFDNTNTPVTLFTEAVNGSDFSTGEHKITYKATDQAGNKAECTFVVIISNVNCKPYPPPVNGAVACKYSGIWGGDQCTPQCSSKYEFSRTPAQAYYCLSHGQWYIFDFRPSVDKSMPWPDCSEEYVPGAVRKGMEWQYFVGDCSDPSVQEQIKQNLIDGIKETIGQGNPNFCEMQNACSVENVKVKCGATSNGRRRRSQNVITIELNLDVFSKGREYNTVKGETDAYANQAESNLQTLKVAGVGDLTLKELNKQESFAVCSGGAVFGRNQEFGHETKCQTCPSGEYYKPETDVTGACTACPLDKYQDFTGRLDCSVCPAGRHTLSTGSKNITQCLQACKAGEYSPTGLAACKACDIAQFQPDIRQKSCLQCPGSTVTLSKGAKSLSDCGMPCAAGTFSKTGVEPCEPCPIGQYQDERMQTSCKPCTGDKATYGKGASSASQCKDLNFCSSSPCNNGGVCSNVADGYQCKCAAGFHGNNCEKEDDECANNPCAKGATCVDKVNSYKCLCPPGYSGTHCEVSGSDCKADSCKNSGKCVELPGGFECVCADGYVGAYCESKIYECASSPCQNGGTCSDEVGGYTCACRSGFSGDRCERNDNSCNPDSCKNGAVCQDTADGHECSCPAGYGGLRCEVNINECASSPCQNNGFCVDQINAYKCLCKPSFTGNRCEQEISADFDLSFSRDKGRGASIVEMRQELRAFTVAFWMKVSNSELDPGTPISYAATLPAGSVDDNALVIHDYNGFNIWINSKKAATNVPANDGKWHHMAFTWKSVDGHWKVYKDGVKVKYSSEAFQKGEVIPAGGLFVLGQEQDNLGRNFSANEAFIGQMSQMNVWSYELPASDVEALARHAQSNKGNVVGWGDFFVKADVGVTKIVPSKARTDNKCWTQWFNTPKTGTGDHETRPGAACSKPSSFDCQTVEGLSRPDLELNITQECSANGIKCLDAEQWGPRTCPDFRVRYVCACPANSACQGTNPCKNGGNCNALPVGYQCSCPDGYEGRHCEQAINCPNIGPLANGQVSGSTGSGSTVTVSCNSGFSLTGSKSLTCTNGRWVGTIPSCVDIDECAQGKCAQSCVNLVGSYRCGCSPGYLLQNDGSCKDFNQCSNRNGDCQHKCIDQVGKYHCACNQGYQLQSDGHSCADINECANNEGRGPCEHVCVNKLAGYSCQCNPGFSLNSDGRTCKAHSCSHLAAPGNGKREPSTGAETVHSSILFECNEGYRLRGSSMRTCSADGTWSGTQATCEVMKCISPGNLLNGAKSGTAHVYNSVVSYSCNSGFRLVGSASRKCQSCGAWSGDHPRCIHATCDEPAAPANGKVVGSQRSTGDTIRFECDLGFKLAGNSYAVCQAGGSWSHATPTCQVISCGQPPALANGGSIVHGINYGEKVNYHCNQNFHLSGSAERTCQLDGTWSGVQPECLEHSCGNPGTPLNGIKVGEQYKYGNIVQFSCNEGYNLVGSSSRTCQTNGLWTGTQPTCDVINCGDPGMPSNGERHGNEFTYGKVVTYDCLPKYKLVGSRQRTCGSNGQWDGSQPSCQASKCGGLLSGQSGSFSSDNYPNPYEDNSYCRWKITVASDMKAMVTFNAFKTQQDKDVVEVYDGASGELITSVSGVHNGIFSFTSNSHILDIKFVSDGDQTSSGFQASYKAVSCGGRLTKLEDVIQSPNFPNNYPFNARCVWQVDLGHPFQLEFDSFDTEEAYDFLKAYDSLSSFTGDTFLFDFDGTRFQVAPVSVPSGKAHLTFTSNGYRNRKGFSIRVKQFVVNGRKRRRRR